MDKQSIALFQQRLHQWYAIHGRRELPWRNNPDPYAIYISEVMLQQTQVKTVLGRYYFPFLQRFPTLLSLAKANENDVLQVWQGLGYYNRALNLHKAAQASKDGLPSTIEALVALPGIGMNTAHAIAAFAFKQPVAVMEANVKRVLSRIFALRTPQANDLWAKADALLDRRNPFDYNQAMMDIGALVCTKTAPKCKECPAQAICEGKSAPEHYPATKAKKEVRVRKKKIVVLSNRQKQYYATARSSRFLSGLFHFIELDAEANTIVLSGKSYVLASAKRLSSIRQQYSHFTLEADIWLMEEVEMKGNHWYSGTELAELPMSMAEQKILQLLGITNSK